MNKTVLTISGVVIVGVIGFLIFTSGDTTPKPVANNNSSTTPLAVNDKSTGDVDSDGDGLPDNAEVLLGTDPQNPDTNGNGINDKFDPNPTKAEAPVNTAPAVTGTTPTKVDPTTPALATVNDFSINSVLVENNVDAVTGKGTSDHLEIFLKSTGKQDINSLSLYYTITDLVTNEAQSYTVPLTGFVLKAGETTSVHVDTSGEAGHFRANPNSLYYKSPNEMQFVVTVSAPGHLAQTLTVKKDKGGAELAD